MNCVVEFHSAMRIRIDGLERAVEHIMELVRRLPCTSVDLDGVELASLKPWRTLLCTGTDRTLARVFRSAVVVSGQETCYWRSRMRVMGSTIIWFRIPPPETTCFRNMVAASF